jgi:uncharacterized membrane protein
MPSREHYGDTLQLRADLWRVPFVLCLAAVLLFVVTIEVDRAAARGAVTLPEWISIGGPDDARAILGAMLTAVSTVLALIFSVALLVLSMAVSQFGPRILYRFVRDGITQMTIGLFLATFVHTLLTFVVTRQEGPREFVPDLTLFCSVVLVMVSFVFLVVFSHRIAMSIQTQNVVARIVADLDAALVEWWAEAGARAEPARSPSGAAELEALLAQCAAEGAVVRATRTGFVQEIDHLSLVAAAERTQAVVRLLYRPGQFVMEDAVLAYVVPAGSTAELTPLLVSYVRIGTHRTLNQDLEFGIAQLVEIALRALSPAVNDTFTGLTCVDWLGDELRAFARRGEISGAWLGPSGVVRLVRPPLRASRLVKGAFDQIRQAAARNPAVSIRLLQTFGRLAERVEGPRVREALAQQVEAVSEGSSADTLVKADRTDLEAAYRAAREALSVR